jgi:hypothetical protein
MPQLSDGDLPQAGSWPRIGVQTMAERPYIKLLRALDAGSVSFAVAGGFAVVLHGVPRMTFDLDIVVDDSDENMERLVSVLGQEGFQPRLPVPLRKLADSVARQQWISERNLIAFTVTHPARIMEELDVVLVSPFPWSEIAASRVFREIDGVHVPVVGRQLLRRMKLASGRDKDRIDAELLGDADE